MAHLLGVAVGLLSLLRGRHRRLLRDNLRHVGLYTAGTLLGAAMELGKGLAELPLVWLRPQSRLDRWVRRVEGWEHVEAARAGGHGVMLLAPHLGCWEICGINIAGRMPVTALYTPPPQAWVHEAMRIGRERNAAASKTVPPTTAGVRALLTRLRQGEAAFILPDQVANRGEGIWVRFFDRDVYMPSLPYRLVASTGAVPLLVFAERLSWGRGYRQHILPLSPASDRVEDIARATNELASRVIRAHPQQYLWSYRLFRAQEGIPPPPGDKV